MTQSGALVVGGNSSFTAAAGQSITLGNAGNQFSGTVALASGGPGDLQVVVHSRSVGVIDPALYQAVGADLERAAVLQAKSHISFKAGFEPITPRSVVAETTGPTTCLLETLPYTRRPRPLYPFEDA